jgi:putative ABC transport system substrate-binding protein
MNFEYGMGGKWLELLKQVAPNVTRAAGSGAMQFAAVQTAAPSLKIDVSPINLRALGELEQAVATFARAGNGGLTVTANVGTVRHRSLYLIPESVTLGLPRCLRV